jgi:hypothetical protein
MKDDPIRADHRFIRYQIKNFMKGNILHDPDEYAHVCRVFSRAGGSWERLFKGSAQDVVLLRRIIKIAVKEGHISKAPRWR